MLALVLVCSIAACSKSRSSSEPSRTACASACAALVAPACGRNESLEVRQAVCSASCSEARSLSQGAGCGAEHDRYLSCVSRTRIDCPEGDLREGSALEHASGVMGCAAEHERYRSCTAPCREPGVVHAIAGGVDVAGAKPLLSAEVVGGGCEDSRLSARAMRSAAGAPCSHYSVCTSVACSCAASSARYLARACVEGRCAGATSACMLAPKAVGQRVCPR